MTSLWLKMSEMTQHGDSVWSGVSGGPEFGISKSKKKKYWPTIFNRLCFFVFFLPLSRLHLSVFRCRKRGEKSSEKL